MWKNDKIDTDVTELLAEARSIRHAVQYGVLSYEDAKAKVQPLLKRVNEICKLIAKRYGRRYRPIRFSDL